MKRLVILLLIISPFVLSAQGNITNSVSTNYNWNYVGEPAFAFGGYWWQGTYLSLAFGPSEKAYVAFTDWANDGKLTVMKFEGNQWMIVGNVGFSAGTANYVKLIFNDAGQPFIAYRDGGNSQKATVMKFDGLNWVPVGNPGFSTGEAFFTSPTFSPTGELYIAFSDLAFDSKATVKKFDGINWIDLGNPHFSDGAAYFIYLTFNNSNEPCVGYSDYSNGRKATVKCYDGTSWTTMGSNGFSVNEAQDINLQLNPVDHKLYISYKDLDWGNYLRSTVMRYDETGWVTVGTAGFSPGEVGYPSFKISKEGKLYVGFGDAQNNYKASVMTFNGSNWVMVGNPGISPGDELWLNELAVNQNGTPYFAFNDRGHNTDSCMIYVMKYDSVTVGVAALLSKVCVYPNPATSEITFDLPSIQGQKTKLEILTANGFPIYECTLTENKVHISLTDFPKGLYLFRVSNDNSYYSGKFLKN
ncbi:MAG: T9SS type A sorting domain-containing protein [Paludibacter sp.]